MYSMLFRKFSGTIYEFVNGDLRKGTQLGDGELQKTELFVGLGDPCPEHFRTF
jgi:hypothetical protein